MPPSASTTLPSALRLRLRVVVLEGRLRWEAHTWSLGIDGLLLVTDTPPTPDALLTLEFSLPPDGARFVAHAMTRAHTGVMGGGAQRVPLLWYGLDAATRGRWYDFLRAAHARWPQATREPVDLDDGAERTRRRERRVTRRLLVRSVSELASPIRGYTLDVSTRGMLIATDADVPVGTRFIAEVSLPEGGPAWLMEAVVRRRVVTPTLKALGVATERVERVQPKPPVSRAPSRLSIPSPPVSPRVAVLDAQRSAARDAPSPPLTGVSHAVANDAEPAPVANDNAPPCNTPTPVAASPSQTLEVALARGRTIRVPVDIDPTALARIIAAVEAAG